MMQQLIQHNGTDKVKHQARNIERGGKKNAYIYITCWQIETCPERSKNFHLPCKSGNHQNSSQLFDTNQRGKECDALHCGHICLTTSETSCTAAVREDCSSAEGEIKSQKSRISATNIQYLSTPTVKLSITKPYKHL